METSRISANFSKSRFADYFVICGLDISSGLEPDNFGGDKLGCPPLDRPYRCRVLGHYPENVPWNLFDKDAVSMLCLPHGLQFRTQKNSLEPKFHSFVITKQDGSRTYGASYVFFEEARNRKICSAMQTLQAMHVAELSTGRHKRSMGSEGSTRSLPRHFKLSTPAAHRAALSYYEHTKDILYVTKSVAIISQHPYVHAPHAFLTGLYRCWKEQGKPSLESQVYSLLYEVTVPPPGRSISFMCYPQEKMILQRPTTLDELPLFDFPLRELFTLLGVETVIQLFTCILLENQILLCSSEYQRLMVVAESLTTLLVPFCWPHVYVPILPASCRHFLDAPVPFIMGLHTSEPTTTSITQANLCFVDLDNRLLQLPEELPVFPNKSEFIYEICQTLKQFKVSGGQLDIKNMNMSGDLMTSSCILSTTRTRKHSWANELDDESPGDSSIVSIAKQTGFNLDSFGNCTDWDSLEDDGFSEEIETSTEAQYARDLKVNNALRQIFLNRFVHIFMDYERFIIQPNQDREQWLSNRESMQNFDKATFLSDQPHHHLPFLSRFIDTQMFATLIDNKILSSWSKMDPNLRVFEYRISTYRKEYESGRVNYYESCSTIEETQALLDYRLNNIDTELTLPREVMSSSRPSSRQSHGFPLLDSILLNQEIPRKRGRGRLTESHSSTSLDELECGFSRVCSSEAQPLPRNAKLATLPKKQVDSQPSSALIAHTNWNFVEKLLKDCKTRTKRMLVEKLGSEGLDMGHSEATSLVEENTLIASLCDLLERVWSHGLHSKQGKSALWSHLVSYLELEDKIDTNRLPNSPEPALRSRLKEKIISSIKSSNLLDLASFLANNFDLSGSSDGDEPKNDSRRSLDDTQQPSLRPLPTTLAYDLRNIQAMTDIKTHIGYARAFVKLSLEKKLLSRHLRTLLSDSQLLRSKYKRYAFLRCEEEKDQFLYHLLTLNAVDYYCFTTTYLNTRIPYRVAVYTSKRTNSTTSANCWIVVSGTNCETSTIPIPKGALEFVFHHRNLGILTTLRIGHDNAGLSSKWLVDYVVVRNEVSGHTYSFECGRWLGRGIDDDSTERLLIGRREEEGNEHRRNQSRLRSPSVPPPRRPLPLADIHQMLGNCINCIVKQMYQKPNRMGHSETSLTALLCGETGLVSCLQHAFLYGFKSSRLFGRNLYIWDFIVKVKEEKEYSVDIDEVDKYFCNLVDNISNCNQSVGKDGKFQVFVCVGVRDHMLHHMIEGSLSRSKAVIEMFEESSFFRDSNLLSYIFQLLESLDDYDIVLENSVTQGIKS